MKILTNTIPPPKDKSFFSKIDYQTSRLYTIVMIASNAFNSSIICSLLVGNIHVIMEISPCENDPLKPVLIIVKMRFEEVK